MMTMAMLMSMMGKHQPWSGKWLYDDEKRPRLLETHELEHLSTNTYLVFLLKAQLMRLQRRWKTFSKSQRG